MVFNRAFNLAFKYLPDPVTPMDSSGGGPFGTMPYADTREFVEWVPPEETPITYPPFHPTDARAVEIYLEPLHYNLLPNPSLRAGTAGWLGSQLTLNTDSWIGQSLEFTSDGELTHEKIWVGPENRRASGDSDWYESRLGDEEYTFSLFAKGADMLVQMSLYGYRPKDVTADVPEPEDTPSAQVHSPQMLVNTDDWERFSVQTTSRMGDISSGETDFVGCWWVVPKVTVVSSAALHQPVVLLSSFMIDLSEGPLCDYFDGDVDEGGLRDDFIWLLDRDGNQRFSAYYPQRLERCTWLHRHLYEAVPVNRPVHIYYHDRANAWDPGGPPPHELTGDLRIGQHDGPSLFEVAVSRYGDLVNPLP